MQRREFIKGLGASALLPLPSGSASFKLAFGSCADQTQPQPIWDAIVRQNPSAFAFLGDNVYADTEDMELMKSCYRRLGECEEFRRFRSRKPIVATWDDHDFGANDAGEEFPKKHESKQILLDFFAEPKNSPRRQRPGVYESYFWNSNGSRVQLILLDLRWFRSPLARNCIGDYVPSPDPRATLLGEAQWQWLDLQLREPADLRILGSSIQFLAEGHPWERWSCFPLERRRLVQLLRHRNVRNLVIISGDMHFGEISVAENHLPWPLYEVTSSGLNRFEKATHSNPGRLGLFDSGANFGLLTWEDQRLKAEVLDQFGRVRLRQELPRF